MPRPAESTAALARALDRERRARERAERMLEDRSRELFEHRRRLEASHEATVEAFASLVSGRRGRKASLLRSIARRARRLAERRGLTPERAKNVYLSALLCDIGKLVLPDELLVRPYGNLGRRERALFKKHPRFAFDALMGVPSLSEAAEIILDHCELVDGSGYPSGKTGPDIRPESLILGVVKDFDALRRGLIVDGALTQGEAVAYLQAQAGVRYDEGLVADFVALLRESDSYDASVTERRLTLDALKPGMTLMRDLVNERDVLILPAGRTLSVPLIDKLRRLARDDTAQLLLHVSPGA